MKICCDNSWRAKSVHLVSGDDELVQPSFFVAVLLHGKRQSIFKVRDRSVSSMSLIKSTFFWCKTNSIAKGPVKHVKLISLEGGDAHVFHSVAENHRPRSKKRIMIAIEPPKVISLMNLLIKVCAHLRWNFSILIKKCLEVFHVFVFI